MEHLVQGLKKSLRQLVSQAFKLLYLPLGAISETLNFPDFNPWDQTIAMRYLKKHLTHFDKRITVFGFSSDPLKICDSTACKSFLKSSE